MSTPKGDTMFRSALGILATMGVLLAACGGPPPRIDGGTCAPGTEGCPCASNRCGKGAQGEQLVCMGELCEQMSCPAGSSGCVCAQGTTCSAAGDLCKDGFCIGAACTPGTKNCSCLAGSCDVGSSCLAESVCVDSTGYEGGACLSNGSCYRGSRCDASTHSCVFCTLGSSGCACTQAHGCNAGLSCAADVCTAANQLPPKNPVCYTPCRDNLETDAGTVICEDGVIPGCLAGQSCTQGSCVKAGDPKPSCSGDLDCPFFQTCLAKGCYSNCEVNADCSSGLGCFKHVCRTTCAVSKPANACPAGSACTASDGENGFCTALTGSAASTSSPPTGGLMLPITYFALSNVSPSASFTLVPKSPYVQDITVRKLWHEITYKDGTHERVDAPVDSHHAYLACDAAKGECPLSWLQLTAPGGTGTLNPTVAFRLLPGCVDAVTAVDAGNQTPCPSVGVANAGGRTDAIHWQGALEITSRDATTVVTLEYTERPEGQWTGSMFYFGTFGREGLDPWINGADKSATQSVENGLIQLWGALRLNNLGGWSEFLAVLTATRTESWKFPNVANRCKAQNGNSSTVACYPFDNATGLGTYVLNTANAPIPSGVSELPVAMNLKISPTDPTVFEGRVVSSLAMHYPGNPAVKLQFAASPAVPSSCFLGGGTDCLIFLKNLPDTAADTNRLISDLGGRYFPNGAPCAPGYAAVSEPWLVPGFVDQTDLSMNGLRTRTVCRDLQLPFDASANASLAQLNQSLAGGNPVPDGNARRRTLRFLDGALVNQSELFILFEENYASFIPGQANTTAYGFMRLRRAAAALEPKDYVGLQPSTVVKTPPINPGAICAPSLLAAIPNSNAADKSGLIKVLMNGTDVTTGFTPLATNGTVHYFCEDTGKFNGGERDDGTPAAQKLACPAGSKVVFFLANRTAAQMAAESCQTQSGPDHRSRCFDTLSLWRLNGNVISEESPFYQCLDPADVYCDDNRLDLRAGKRFFSRNTGNVGRTFLGLRPLIDAAFRYKTRFRSSVSGSSLGFAPQQCVPNSDSLPYCYDPSQIEEARQRVDCLISLYSDGAQMTQLGSTNPALRSSLYRFLQQNFSTFTATFDGFERLYAELLIMQGDESLTAAYASRFDIAASGGASFKGSDFEPGGIDLTGVAGAEMYRLYQSVQYYQLALDRLYQLGPNMQTALARAPVGADPDFITPEMVTSYLERLVRAASQKSVAWAEIAKRYQNFNRPELARRVVERAFVGTYLESALISRLMLDISRASAQSAKAQIDVTIEKAQRSYRMALLEMREVYGKVTDQTNYFGFPADYIPFPSLEIDSNVVGVNAYNALSTIVRQRLELAKTREQIALTFGKQGKVDAAQFQSDLTSIRNTYENQLSQICGTFIASDAKAYPAIRKYAQLSPVASLMGDPCGRMGNGDLHNSMAAVKDSGLKLQGVVLNHQNKLKEIDIERGRAAAQCNLTTSVANFQYSRSGIVYDMQLACDAQRALSTLIGASAQAIVSSMQVADCEIQCASSSAMGTIVGAVGIAAAETQFASELLIAEQERQMRDFERDSVRMTTLAQCGATQIDSQARVATLFNETLEIQLEALRADYAVRLAMAEVQRLAGTAQRLQAQQEETEQLAINVAAAQNDPNVRIYQNDAVINADVSFSDALSMAYRLTRVYEYYSSQSYAKKEQLFLIRMVTAGQYNLENYLLELDNEFLAFQDQFGNPDIRVLALSLRDDILKVPYLSPTGIALTESQRIKIMQDQLRDVRALDSNGYLTLPFSTNVRALSPLTRNHKIEHVEVDLQGGKMGDNVARVYLRMSGTGSVRTVNDETDFFVFPSRLAVINASLQGSKVYDSAVYRSYRFRDRPLVNTLWELVINQRDELVNKDIDLGTVSDIRVVLYYTDFTAF
jgi:hypothetical protein